MVFFDNCIVRSIPEADFTKPMSIGHEMSVMKCMLYSGAQLSFWVSDSITSFVVHTRDNASATGIASPCLYLTSTSKFMHLSNSLCNLAGASAMFFSKICSSGEWSVSTRVEYVCQVGSTQTSQGRTSQLNILSLCWSTWPRCQ